MTNTDLSGWRNAHVLSMYTPVSPPFKSLYKFHDPTSLEIVQNEKAENSIFEFSAFVLFFLVVLILYYKQ